MKTLILLTALLQTLTQSVEAQVATLVLKVTACNEIRCFNPEINYGTAVAIAHISDGTVWITAAHNFEHTMSQKSGVKTGSQSVQVENLKAVLVLRSFNEQSDYALVTTTNKNPLVPLRDSEPEIGETLRLCGFTYPVATPKRLSVKVSAKSRLENFWMISEPAQSGMSGGSAVDDRGCFCAVITWDYGVCHIPNLRGIIKGLYPSATFLPCSSDGKDKDPVPVPIAITLEPLQELRPDPELTNLINVLLGKVEELRKQVDSLSGNASSVTKLQDEFNALVLLMKQEKQKFESRIKVLEDRKINVIVVRNGKIVDSESYTGKEDDPIVISGVGG